MSDEYARDRETFIKEKEYEIEGRLAEICHLTEHLKVLTFDFLAEEKNNSFYHSRVFDNDSSSGRMYSIMINTAASLVNKAEEVDKLKRLLDAEKLRL